jgi:hypothetical protein
MYIHINRHELKKMAAGKGGRPWTIHMSGKCIRASDVRLSGQATAQCFPERPTNPKCFVVVEGTLKRLGAGKYEIVSNVPARAKIAGVGVMDMTAMLRRAEAGLRAVPEPKPRR